MNESGPPEGCAQEVRTPWKRSFFILFAGQSLSLFGSALVQFALVWYLARQTGSATILAAATMVVMLPPILLGPFIGTLVDRTNRRAVMMLADGAVALATLALALLFLLGAAQIWHIYAALLLRALGGAFHTPAMASSLSLMVPRKQYARVAGIQQTLQGLVGIVAPPAGAVLLEVMHTQGVLMIDVATALLAIIPLAFIPIPQPVRLQAGEKPKTSYRQDLRAGFAAIGRWPGLKAVMFLAAFINFLIAPTGSLMPLLVTKHFGLGALQYGLTDALLGFGMIGGGLLLSVWGGFKRHIATTLAGVAGIGAGILVMGLAPAGLFPLALAGAAIIGIMASVANGPLQAVILTTVDPEMQGRVLSLVGSAAMAMSPLALAVAGPIADLAGIRAWYIAGGAVCMLVGLGAFFIPSVIHMESSGKRQADAS
jgi:MFS transporter, DHA3 family, macrolide efflux protein